MFTRTEENKPRMCYILREVETNNRINPGPQSANKQYPPQESKRNQSKRLQGLFYSVYVPLTSLASIKIIPLNLSRK